MLNFILPEARIEDIVDNCDPAYTDQCVDFYCPRANLVLEIDGPQHETGAQSYLDRNRDLYLEANGIATIRITTNKLDASKAAQALHERFDEGENVPNDFDEKTAFAYEIAMRLQMALLSLIKQGALALDDPTWTIDFICDQPDVNGETLVKEAANDLLDLFENLCVLAGLNFKRPTIRLSNELADVTLDISATKMWSDIESEKGTVYVRNDYYESVDHFFVSNADPIVYKTTDASRRGDVDAALAFFLEYFFGYSDFRPGQAGIIKKALARNATLGILPTGSGKSLCYQMACLLQPCINFVVCPIISLIQDQEVNAREFGIDRVGRIESQMDASEKNKVLDEFGQGRHFFIWIAPERFQMANFRNQLSKIASDRHFGYAVIDEVHCLSEWGHDFRVSYLRLHGTIKRFCPEAQTLALTATASRNVLEDLLCELEITKANVQTSTSLDRPELSYHIVKTSEADRAENLQLILDHLNDHFCASEGVSSIFEPNGDDSICGIVFCNTKKHYSRRPYAACDDVQRLLREKGVASDTYYAPKDNGSKTKNDKRALTQKRFLANEFTLMSATKAFGMGVNKKNVRYTIHNGLPWSIEAFYQEAGRAGRDPSRNASECFILYSNESDPIDVRTLFEEKTSVSEIRETQKRLHGDLSTLFFLWSGNHEDPDIERLIIVKTFIELKQKRTDNGHATIPFNLVRKIIWPQAIDRMKRQKGSTKAELHVDVQDALYKLAILGIVIDWTVDRQKEIYDVEMRKIDSSSEGLVKSSLEAYIRRHNPTFSFDNPLPAHRAYVEAYERAPQDKKLLGLIDVLLLWTNDNIVFSRRRSIGNMLDLCESDRSEQEIRSYINSYFRLDTESNDQLDAIVREASDTDSWVRLFMTYRLTDDPSVQEDVLKDAKEIEAIAALCDRYRESFHANIGLEWSTMLAKLLSGTFSEPDVDDQFGFISSEITGYEGLDANELFTKTLSLMEGADDRARDAFGAAVVNHSPKRALQTYEQLGDTVTLNHLVTEASNKLKATWGRKRSA